MSSRETESAWTAHVFVVDCLSCFHAAEQSIDLAAHCWCVRRQPKKCHNEVVTMDEARKSVAQWTTSSTEGVLTILANPPAETTRRAIETGRLFAKQAAMATWVLTHSRDKGHAPTSAQISNHGAASRLSEQPLWERFRDE